MSIQIAIRIPSSLAQQLEELVASGRFDTKADAVRSALEALIDAERRAEIGQRITEGYRRIPQEADEVAAARKQRSVRSMRSRGDHRPCRDLVG